MHLYEKRNRIKNRDLWIAGAIFLAVILLFALVFSGFTEKSSAREERLLENAIRRAAVTCYAVEGKYPESLDYLCKNYGVAADTERYLIRYEVFSSNVMPAITVFTRGGAS